MKFAGIGLEIARTLLEEPFNANVITISKSYPNSLQALESKHVNHLLVFKGDPADIDQNKVDFR